MDKQQIRTALGLDEMIAEQATGCVGAGSYRAYAENLGYTHIEVLNWSSSAGDWQFLVSKDGFEWRVLYQENNYPRPGFSHAVDDEAWYGALDDVYEQIEALYGGW